MRHQEHQNRYNGRQKHRIAQGPFGFIAPAFAHSGYGTEAFAAVADWALYQLQLRAVVAKCYKENQASFRMLSSCMRRAGEDETFFYFRKEV